MKEITITIFLITIGILLAKLPEECRIREAYRMSIEAHQRATIDGITIL